MKCKNCGRQISKVPNTKGTQWVHTEKPDWVFSNYRSYGISGVVLPYASGNQVQWCTPKYSRHCVARPADYFDEPSELYMRLFRIQDKNAVVDRHIELDSIAWTRFKKLKEVNKEPFTYRSKVYVHFSKVVYRLYVNDKLVFTYAELPHLFPSKEELLGMINKDLTLEMLEKGEDGTTPTVTSRLYEK